MNHEKVEKSTGLLIIFTLIALSFGTLVEIVPLFFQAETTQPIKGLKPLTPLQHAGRDIYIREGCHVCHTQMIRPLRAETERYGHYSVAGESVYEYPFLWGSKRTGPDLARVGQRYSDDWHKAHLLNPRNVVPESNMPAYPWLFENDIDPKKVITNMKGLRKVGVPYTDESLANAPKQLQGKKEIDALVAYLQQLGTSLKYTR